MNRPVVEYYFALASPWSYLGNDRLRAIAAAHGAIIDPVIVDYDPMFAAAGTIPLPHGTADGRVSALAPCRHVAPQFWLF